MSTRLKPYRCHNPQCADPGGRPEYDFWAEEGQCPRCGASERDPQSARLITRLTVVHLDPPSPWPGRGLGRQACDGAAVGRKPASGDVRAVTCPACRATEAFRQAALSQGWEDVEEIGPDLAAQLAERAKGLVEAKGVPRATAV